MAAGCKGDHYKERDHCPLRRRTAAPVERSNSVRPSGQTELLAARLLLLSPLPFSRGRVEEAEETSAGRGCGRRHLECRKDIPRRPPLACSSSATARRGNA